eukprot:381087-Pelagomonas_calceolata.AAC.3
MEELVQALSGPQEAGAGTAEIGETANKKRRLFKQMHRPSTNTAPASKRLGISAVRLFDTLPCTLTSQQCNSRNKSICPYDSRAIGLRCASCVCKASARGQSTRWDVKHKWRM